VNNLGSVPLDVTILHVNGKDYGMQVVFPPAAGDGDVRLPPGKSLLMPRERVKTDIKRLEQILLIATEAKGPPVNFGFLTQPSLSAARRTIESSLSERIIDSSFGRLLQNALYANDAIRGLDVKTLEQLALRRLSWQTIPRAEGAIRLARHLFNAEHEQWEQAESDFREAVANTASLQILLDPWPWKEKSIQRRSAQIQWAEVLSDFSSLIKAGRDEWWVWRGRGLAHAGQSDWEESATDFEKSTQGKPDDYESWRALGLAYAETKRLDQAVAACTKAIELKQQSWEIWYQRGIVYKKLGQNHKAVLDYSKAIELGAKGWGVWAERGLAHTELGQWQEAVLDFSKAIELKAGDYDLWTLRANAYKKLRQWDRALADYSEAVKLEPEKAEAWQNRGQFNAERGAWNKAAGDFEKAVVLSSGEKAWYRLELALLASGEPGIYRETFEGMLQNFAETKDANVANVVALLGTLLPDAVKDPAALVHLAMVAVASKPDNHVYLETLGAALYRAGRFEEAVKRLQEAVAKQGEGGTVWMQLFLAMTHHRLGRMVAAPRVVALMGAPMGPLLAVSPLPCDLEARHMLDLARKQIQATKDPRWEDRIGWQYLLREAEGLLYKTPAQ
jgi:tetratricopeptide (TPR) repeat protein